VKRLPADDCPLDAQVVLLSNAFPRLEKLDVAVNTLGATLTGNLTQSEMASLCELVVGDCGIASWKDVVAMFGWLPS
jgi:hypothetical protein